MTLSHRYSRRGALALGGLAAAAVGLTGCGSNTVRPAEVVAAEAPRRECPDLR